MLVVPVLLSLGYKMIVSDLNTKTVKKEKGKKKRIYWDKSTSGGA